MGIEFTLIHKDNVPHPVEQVAHESQFLHESASYRVRARGCALLVTSSTRRDYLTERGRLDKKKKGQREIERKIQTVDSSSNGSYNSNSSHPHVRATHESAQRPHARIHGRTRLPHLGVAGRTKHVTSTPSLSSNSCGTIDQRRTSPRKGR